MLRCWFFFNPPADLQDSNVTLIIRCYDTQNSSAWKRKQRSPEGQYGHKNHSKQRRTNPNVFCHIIITSLKWRRLNVDRNTPELKATQCDMLACTFPGVKEGHKDMVLAYQPYCRHCRRTIWLWPSCEMPDPSGNRDTAVRQQGWDCQKLSSWDPPEQFSKDRNFYWLPIILSNESGADLHSLRPVRSVSLFHIVLIISSFYSQLSISAGGLPKFP